MCLDQSVLTGVFGLAGVVVGAASTGFVEWKLLTRREVAERRRDEAERAVRVRQAARLVMDDFAAVSAHIAVCLEDGKGTPTVLHAESQLTNWQVYQGVLASELDDDRLWRALANAATAARQAANTLARFPSGADVPPSWLDLLRDWRGTIDKTSGILGPFARVNPH